MTSAGAGLCTALRAPALADDGTINLDEESSAMRSEAEHDLLEPEHNLQEAIRSNATTSGRWHSTSKPCYLMGPRRLLLAVLACLAFAALGGCGDDDGPPSAANGGNAATGGNRPSDSTQEGNSAGGAGGSDADEIKALVEQVGELANAEDSAACDSFSSRAVATIWEGMYEEGKGYQECVDTLGNWFNATPLNFVDSDYPSEGDWKSVTDIQVDGELAIGHPVRVDGGTDPTNLEFVKQDGEWKIDAHGACSTPELQQECTNE